MKNIKEALKVFFKLSIVMFIALALLAVAGCSSGGNKPADDDEEDPDFTITGVTVFPTVITIEKGKSFDGFSATVLGTGDFTQDVTWTVGSSSASPETKFTDGILTIDAEETLGSIPIRAYSVDDPEVFGTANVLVANTGMGPLVTAVNISPAEISLEKGSTRAFTATVTGTNNPSQLVTWSVTTESIAAGTVITGNSLKIDSEETAAEITIRAVSIQDSSKYGEAVVTVLGEGEGPTVTDVTITPSSSVSVARGGTLKFTADVIGENDPSQVVTWTIRTAGIRKSTTIDSTGLLTVAASEKISIPNLLIRATPEQDPSRFKEVAVALTGDFYHPNVHSGECSGVMDLSQVNGWTWELAHWLTPLEEGDYTISFYHKGGAFRPVIFTVDAAYCVATAYEPQPIGRPDEPQAYIVPTDANWTQHEIKFHIPDLDDEVRFVIQSCGTQPIAYFDDVELTLDGGNGDNLLADPGFESGSFAYNLSEDSNPAQKATAGQGWWGWGKEYVYIYKIDE